MPNFWTLVWGPPEFRRFSAEIRFAEMRRGRITLLRLGGCDKSDVTSRM